VLLHPTSWTEIVVALNGNCSERSGIFVAMCLLVAREFVRPGYQLWLGIVQVESSCELGNEPSGSVKCCETTEWLHNLWPLEWCSAPQS
jgi:hypothetical protein